MQKESGSFLENISRVKHFWLREGEKRKILFLDNCDYDIYLHNIPIINKFGKVQFLFVPCLSGKLRALPCDFCNKNIYKFKYKLATVYDFTPFTDNKGQSKVSGKKLLAMRNQFYKDEIAKLKLKTTYMAEFEAVREMGEKESIGKGWVFEGFNNTINLPPDATTPYDYSQIFCPPTKEELEELWDLNKMYMDRRATLNKSAASPTAATAAPKVTPNEDPYF